MNVESALWVVFVFCILGMLIFSITVGLSMLAGGGRRSSDERRRWDDF